MSDSNNEMTENKPSPTAKLTLILAGGALLLSLVNTTLLLMNSTASKVEHFNEELKSELADSVATLHKKIDGLRTAEQEWQKVLKKAQENPEDYRDLLVRVAGYSTQFVNLSREAQDAIIERTTYETL